jgi:hypothetical protein
MKVEIERTEEQLAIGASREAQRPDEGAEVEFPTPFPPVAHLLDDDGMPREVSVPTGQERWTLAKVVSLHHQEGVTVPDSHAALVQPLDRETGEPAGLEQLVSVVFLEEPKDPAEREADRAAREEAASLFGETE